MTGLGDVTEAPPARGMRARAMSYRVPARVEDWLLAGWMAVVAPSLLSLHGRPDDLFAAGRPVDALLGLIGILGVVACLAARRPVGDADARRPSRRLPGMSWAVLGPFVGGLLLVTVSTITALEVATQAVLAVAVAACAIAVVVRLRVRPLPAAARRALVTPYVIVAGGLFWTAIDAVTAGGDLPSSIRTAVASGGPDVLPIVGFLLAFSAVFYAMLVYAPRQVADRDGTALDWLVRYALFVVSVAFGVGWLSLLGS